MRVTPTSPQGHIASVANTTYVNFIVKGATLIDVVRSDDDKRAISEILTAYNMGGIEKVQGTLVVYRGEDGDVLGCAACASHWSRFDRWLNCVAVRKDCQKQGIGTKLVNHFVRQLLPKHELWLETPVWNKRFYERLGFTWVPIKEISQYYNFDPRARKTTIVMTIIMAAAVEALAS